MTAIVQDIIDAIRVNRISTTEVADALGKRHVLHGLKPLTADFHCVGPVRPVFTAFNSNFGIHDQVRCVEPGEIVVVYAHACDGRALLGDLIARFVTLYRRAAGIAVCGLVRDAARLRRERYPIWSEGVTPLGCYNEESDHFPKEAEMEIRARVEGGIAVCDDGGVVLIPVAETTTATLDKLRRVELQEDIWYYCLNVLKWDTKRIVVDRDYLTEQGMLPDAYADAVSELATRLDGGDDA